MNSLDPATGRPLPPDAIQRILFIAPSVHVYNIPPLSSNKGHIAASWTADNNKRQIFTARLRILETSFPSPSPSNPSAETLKTDILLEDPSNGQLFAAAPYTIPAIVEQVLDSSRFFAVRVQGEGGRKALLGVGFEERSEAFDFSVSLQEVRKTMGIEDKDGKCGGKKPVKEEKKEEMRDFSLKEGETIVVNIGGRTNRRNRDNAKEEREGEGGFGGSARFSLPPPPGGGGGGFLPPPPSAQEVKAQKRISSTFEPPKPKEDDHGCDNGFDDGEFGEFQ